MSNVIEYNDLMAFHPGYYVEEVLEEMQISQAEFAVRMGTTPKTLSLLLSGQIGISNDLAKKLSIMLGTGPEVWLNLQNSYDKKLIEIEMAKDFERQKTVARLLEYRYFVRNAGIKDTTDENEQIENLCRCFALSDLNTLTEVDYLVPLDDADPAQRANARTWIQIVINKSKLIKTQPYNAEKLKETMNAIRKLTTEEPSVILPELGRQLAACGVAFVLLPYLNNSGINGAVKWTSGDKVVLAIAGTEWKADCFWYTVFHELKHVLQRKVKTVFLNSVSPVQDGDKEAFETDADTFAANTLVPKSGLKQFRQTAEITVNEILSFSEKTGILPAIVARRLFDEKLITPEQLEHMVKIYDFAC